MVTIPLTWRCDSNLSATDLSHHFLQDILQVTVPRRCVDPLAMSRWRKVEDSSKSITNDENMTPLDWDLCLWS